MEFLNARHMTIVAHGDNGSSVTEVVKLPVKPENLQSMLHYVQKWHESVIPGIPGFQGAAILSSATGALIVYAHWTSKDKIWDANHDPRMARYFEGLLPMLAGRPEVHICSVEAIASVMESPYLTGTEKG
jgi:quinol monooxygenase YgiN